jgi:antitoxin VapB
MKTAKIFQHGDSQVVHLPKEFRFKGDEVVVKRHAGGVLLLPRRYAFDDLMSVMQNFKGAIARDKEALLQSRERYS